MARFRFRLQSVLNLREKLENQKELEYAEALRILAEERAKEQALAAEKDGCVAHVKRIVSGESEAGVTVSSSLRMDLHEIARYNGYIEILKERIIAQKKVVAEAEAMTEVRRLALVEAMRDRKTIEKLRENALDEYIQE